MRWLALVLSLPFAGCATGHAVAGWSGWLCADFGREHSHSVWWKRDQGTNSATVYAGTCASWKQRIVTATSSRSPAEPMRE